MGLGAAIGSLLHPPTHSIKTPYYCRLLHFFLSLITASLSVLFHSVCVCVCFGDIRATCCVMVFSQLCFSSRNWSLNILECLTGSWGDVHCQLQLLMVCLISSWQSSSENNITHVESELMPITILRINTNNIHFGSCLLSVNIQWSLSVILTLILILYIL